jgi:hypothetical protein
VGETIVVEFDAAERVVATARRIRELGYVKLEAYSPCDVPEIGEAIGEAIGEKRPRIGALAFAAGAAGAAAALALIHWTNAVDYRLDVGGRPLDSWPADVPIVFEIAVLAAAFAAFSAALVLSGLPRLHHPVFDLEGFERTTVDRFWLTIGDARTAGADVAADELAALREALRTCGALRVRGLDAGRS